MITSNVLKKVTFGTDIIILPTYFVLLMELMGPKKNSIYKQPFRMKRAYFERIHSAPNIKLTIRFIMVLYKFTLLNWVPEIATVVKQLLGYGI